MRTSLLLFSLFIANICLAQKPKGYWQQEIKYQIEVDMNVENYNYIGHQNITYTNNSLDTLKTVYLHLYYNAFQPGSDMDTRLQSIADPDRRMITKEGKSRIASLTPEEIGFLHVYDMTQNGKKVTLNEEETILEVTLDEPILPNTTTSLDFRFEGQVPLQIRRSGRNSSEDIVLSMSQWYPKMVEFDYEGWHTTPYIAREFHGVWGDFDVKISIDKDYTVGGTGYLQNAEDIGHGYTLEEVKHSKRTKKLNWHFVADDVHDFMWAADPNYIHDILTTDAGIDLHFFYKDKEEIKENWKNLQSKTAEAMEFFSKNIGPYPYKQYSVIHGGDGGMEYAMSTLVTGERSFGSLVGVMVHELAHSWFQHILATNESKHAWMDEGFTSFISSLCMNQIMDQNRDNPFQRSYDSYIRLAQSGNEQPLTTHSDRYNFNYAYSVGAYSKGAVFLAQLGYVIGQDNLMKTIRRYYEDFKFTHPTPNDIKRTAERVSGFHLDWYLTDFAQTTNTIDYGVQSVGEINLNSSQITLERKGLMPMPIDLVVVLNDGSMRSYYIPLQEARAEKDNPYPSMNRVVLDDWSWAHPSYKLTIPVRASEIQTVVIDPSMLMADVDRSNNEYNATDTP